MQYDFDLNCQQQHKSVVNTLLANFTVVDSFLFFKGSKVCHSLVFWLSESVLLLDLKIDCDIVIKIS